MSVTTISRTSSYGPWRSSSGIRSRSAGVIHVAARPPDDVAELLARPPDGRRVDDRQELLEVLGEEPVEQRRVAILERGQPDVALERVVLAAEVLELELDLLLDGQDAVGQQPAQAGTRRARSWLKARSLVSSRLPRRAGPASAIDAGRPAAMSSNGAGSGRIQARIAGRTGSAPRPRDAAQPPVTTSVPTIPYASWPGRWQMYRYVPGVSNVTVVVAARAGRDRHLGRARRRGPAPCRCGGARGRRRVADDPFVVDRVVVAEHDRDRHAGRHGQPVRLVVRVVDADLGGHRALRPAARAQAAAIPASPSERTRPPTRARRPGRRTVVIGAIPLRPSTAAGAGADEQDDPADAADQSARCPTIEPDDVERPVRRRPTAPGRSSPAMTRDGAPAPGCVDREVEGELRRAPRRW